MCGITGIIDLSGKNIQRSELYKMTFAISHRGPDAEGYWIKNNVGFGHKRLSILDLSDKANQPMLDSSKNYVLTYNGEIYNFKELRNDLMQKGYRFKTNSDTEVVLYSLIEWGSNAIIKFNGMFAFSFYDSKKNELILCRDRYGIKPLYYSIQNNLILFGSEIKSLTATNYLEKKINERALVEYMSFQNIISENTLLKNVKLVNPVFFFKLNISNRKINKKKYWDFDFNNLEYKNLKESNVEKLEFLIKQSVKRQSVSDVEIGSYLSGGIDSGLITGIASKNLKNFKTFTIGYDLSSASGIELNFDERKKAENLSSHLKTEHYEMVLKPGDLETSIKKLIWHLEDPRVGQSYPNLYAAKLASNHVKVVFSGIGGDELFAGYPWRYLISKNKLTIDKFLKLYFLKSLKLVDQNSLKKLLSPMNSFNNIDVAKEKFMDIFKNLKKQNQIIKPNDQINYALFYEAKTFLHGLLVLEDKLSMAYGLESRVPFLDNDLVDFAQNCPINNKINYKNINNNKFSMINEGKVILRKLSKILLPSNISKRSKQGFSAPDASWFKGESINFIREKLFDKNQDIYNYIDYKETKKLIEKHTKGKSNERLLIWSMLSLQTWFDTFYKTKI